MKPIEYCQERGMKTEDLIRHMQTMFPKYCKAANSMCNHGEEYGVSLSARAVRYLHGKQEEHRTRPCRFTFRLLETDNDAFTRARLKNGHTIQEATEKAVMLYIAATEGRG